MFSNQKYYTTEPETIRNSTDIIDCVWEKDEKRRSDKSVTKRLFGKWIIKIERDCKNVNEVGINR